MACNIKEYYSALTRKGVLPPLLMGQNFEDTMLSDINYTERSSLCDSHVAGPRVDKSIGMGSRKLVSSI